MSMSDNTVGLKQAVGKLEAVSLRDLWRHEERGFSAWLEANLGVLSEATGISMEDPERELWAGNFKVDLVAQTESGDRVIVENQLEQTNHDHLGKVLTYLTNLDAKVAIWIASDARPEHVRAIQWLNETTPDDIFFFLVRLSAFRIGDSQPAPLFTVIVGPSAETKGFGKQKKDDAERHLARLRFWEQLLALAKRRGVTVHAQRAPSRDSWLSAGAGVRSGVALTYLIWKTDEAGIELYIDTGTAEENKLIFDRLHVARSAIESAFGSELSWERMDHRRSSRIRKTFASGGIVDESKWPTIQAEMVDGMSRFVSALRPYLAQAAGA